MIILIIGPALIRAIKHLIAHAANHQALLLHTLLTISLYFPIIHLLALQQVTDLHDQSMSRFDVLIYLVIFVSLLGELSSFDCEAAVLDGLDQGLHDGICCYVTVAFPYPYLKVVVGNAAVYA